MTIPSSCDFPAAHSMDTEWFAVDRDGHVALFVSGESGAVPRVVVEARLQYDDEIEAQLAEPRSRGDARFDLGTVVHPGSMPGEIIKIRAPVPSAGDVVFVVARPGATFPAALSALPTFTRLPSDGGFAVGQLVGEVTGQADPRLAGWRDAMQSIRDAPGLSAIDVTGQLERGRAGVYVYEAHELRTSDPEPYGRLFSPTRPLHVDELPGPIRDRLLATQRLDVSFESARYVQPVEHLPCNAWSTACYLASDGITVRPLPGLEAEYAKHASCLDEEQEGFFPLVFDPPLG